jgi:hypothetical protein
MWASIWAYLAALSRGRRVAFFLADAAGIVLVFWEKWPSSQWWGFLLLAIGLVGGHILSYHDLRTQYTKMKKERDELEVRAKPTFRFGNIDTHDYTEAGGNYHGRGITVTVANDSDRPVKYSVCIAQMQSADGRRVNGFRSGWLAASIPDDSAILSVRAHERTDWRIVFRLEAEERLTQVAWGVGRGWGQPNQLTPGIYHLQLQAESATGEAWGAEWIRLDLYNWTACFIDEPPLVNTKWNESEIATLIRPPSQ